MVNTIEGKVINYEFATTEFVVEDLTLNHGGPLDEYFLWLNIKLW